MELVIKYHGIYAELAGTAEETVQIEEDATLKNLLHRLGEIHGPDFSQQLKEAAIYIGQDRGGFKKADLTELVAPSATVIITPPIIGG